MQRANFLPAPHFFNLNMACVPVSQALDFGVYLVGSALDRRDYRDVDVRAIVSDDQWERMFPGCEPRMAQRHALWSVMCASISLYLSQHSGLPIDFQIQQQTYANAEFPNRRHALGLLIVDHQDGP